MDTLNLLCIGDLAAVDYSLNYLVWRGVSAGDLSLLKDGDIFLIETDLSDLHALLV